MLEMNKDWWKILAQKNNGGLSSVLIFLIYFLLHFSITIYPPYALFHLHSSPSSPITTLLSMSKGPFSFFLIPPPPNPHPAKLSACPLSMSLSLFCLLIQFVHLMPHMSEIIWYLTFSDWLISLSIIFSRSIHAIAEGRVFLLYVAE